MQHLFKTIKCQHLPIPGDLIRSRRTGDFINIVISTSVMRTLNDSNGLAVDYVDVRSVRYGKTCRGNFKLLDGQRSRSIRMFRAEDGVPRGLWEIVEEFVEANNSALRCEIVRKLKDVDTAWRNPDGSSNLPAEQSTEDDEAACGVY